MLGALALGVLAGFCQGCWRCCRWRSMPPGWRWRRPSKPAAAFALWALR
ncbi:MAG: hypothetical protein U0Z44_09440 [Kouleothrix sp.]